MKSDVTIFIKNPSVILQDKQNAEKHPRTDGHNKRLHVGSL